MFRVLIALFVSCAAIGQSTPKEYVLSLPVVAERTKSSAGPLQLTAKDNGATTQVTEIRDARTMPRCFLVLLDASGSMQYYQPNIAKTLNTLFDKLPAYERDEVAVNTFSDHLATVIPFTSDIARLRTAAQPLATRGRTHLFDAIASAARELLARTSRTHALPELIVITDGADNASQSSIGKLEREVAQTGVRVWWIDPTSNNPFFPPGASQPLPEERLGPFTVHALVRASGGDSIQVKQTSSAYEKDLAAQITSIRNTQLVRVAVTPTEKHKIELKPSHGWRISYRSVTYVQIPRS